MLGSVLAAYLLLPLTSAAEADPQVVVARVSGEAVTAGDLRKYIASARYDGYRPATAAEAHRLLNGLIRLRVLDREAQVRNVGVGSAGRTALLDQLAMAGYPAPIVRPAEIDAFVERHPFVASDRARSPAEVRREVAEQLLASKRRIQHRALADQLVSESQVWVSTTAVAALVEQDHGVRMNPPRPPAPQSDRPKGSKLEFE